MSLDRRMSRASSKVGALPYTGWIEPTAAGETIRWGSWDDTPSERRTMAITLFPYSSGSDYSGSTVEQSNYRVLIDDAHVMRRSVIITGGHDTFGVAYIGYPTRPIRKICDALFFYPLLDEDEHSTLEMEIEQEQWADWGRADFRRDLVTEFGDGLDEILDALDEGFVAKTDEHASYVECVAPSVRVLDATWHSFSEHHGDCGRIFEAPNSCHFYIDAAIKWLRETRDLGSILVLGDIEYRERETFAVARDAFLEGRPEKIAEARKLLALWPDFLLVDLETENEHACTADCARECREVL